MKALLICPVARPEVAVLAEQAPLAAVPLLSSTLIEYWLVHLAARGAREVTVLASDRTGKIRRIVADGARWGLRVEVLPAAGEPTIEAARHQAQSGDASGWLPAPDDVVLLDHLPGLPGVHLFESYQTWFAAVQSWMARALTPDRVGFREIQPGVRVGLHSRIHPEAVLIPPCWIGEKVSLGPGVTVGPQAVVEDRAVIEAGAEISHSIVGPETLVGRLTEIRDSLAWGDTLVNWKNASCLRVREPFLLSPLRERSAASSATETTEPWHLSPRWSAAEPAPLRAAGQVLAGLLQQVRVGSFRDENRNPR